MSRIDNINWSQIGKGAIWSDSDESLAERWLSLARNQELSDEISAGDVVARARKRATTVRKFLQLPAAKPIQSARQWDTAWRPAAMRDMLTKKFREHDCVVTLAERRGMSTYELSARYPTGERVIVIEKWVADERAHRLKNAGLLLPFGLDEAILLLMTEDLHLVAAEQMGHQPAAWVDEYARSILAMQILGWPFNPIIGEVAG